MVIKKEMVLYMNLHSCVISVCFDSSGKFLFGTVKSTLPEKYENKR